MLDASTADELSRSVESRAKQWRNCCIDAVTALRTSHGAPALAGKKAPGDPFLTMDALYQLSYVGLTGVS
jgi:hypothetical protein